MIWDLPAIAGFAEQGGFLHRDLAVAIAVAVAASGGDDALTDLAPCEAGPPLVGLWQVPAAGRAGFSVPELARPALNAVAAHALWREAGRSWSWSAAYQSRRWSTTLPYARAVAESGERSQQAPDQAAPGRLGGVAARAAHRSGLTALQLSGLARVLRDATPR